MTVIPVVDLERFRLTAETTAEVAEVLILFRQLTEEKLLLLASAHDTETWRQVMHYLKGSTANLGMGILAATCLQWETHPPVSEQQKEQALSTLQHELQRVHEFFSQTMI